MKFGECKFNPKRDKKAVEQFGFVDLARVMKEGVMPSSVEEGANSYSGIADPSAVMSRPRDVFDMIAQQHAINSYEPPKSPDEGVAES